MRPVAVAEESAFVLVARAPGGVGSTIRWVDRVDPAVPVRTGFRPGAPGRGIPIGCVVADPAADSAGNNKPVGWGGLTEGNGVGGGGV